MSINERLDNIKHLRELALKADEGSASFDTNAKGRATAYLVSLKEMVAMLKELRNKAESEIMHFEGIAAVALDKDVANQATDKVSGTRAVTKHIPSDTELDAYVIEDCK